MAICLQKDKAVRDFVPIVATRLRQIHIGWTQRFSRDTLDHFDILLNRMMMGEVPMVVRGLEWPSAYGDFRSDHAPASLDLVGGTRLPELFR
jgi:hypothetical protein